jgi:hypothetical protein
VDRVSGIQAKVGKQITTVQSVQRRTYVNLIIEKYIHECISIKEFPIYFHKILVRDVGCIHFSNKTFCGE